MMPVLNRSRASRFRLPEYRAVILSDSPLAYWRLGDSGSTAAEEVSSRTGTIGAGVTMGQPGAIARSSNTAASFAPSNTSEILVTNADTFGFGTGAFSVEMWVKPNVSAAFGSAVSRWAAGARNFMAFIDSSQARCFVNDGANGFASGVSATGLTLNGAWHHILFTKSGTTLTAYVDGASVASATVVADVQTGTGTPLAIGNNHEAVLASNGAAWGYDGVLDEVAIYGRSLTASEVARHYRAGV